MKGTSTVLCVVVCGFLITFAGRVQAKDACRADAERLCKGVRPGGGRIAACLQEHAADVSQECQATMTTVREKAAAFMEACGGDAQKLCAGVKPGRGRVVQCLRSHEAELTEACRTAIGK